MSNCQQTNNSTTGCLFLTLGIFTWAGSNIVYKFWSGSYPAFTFMFLRYFLATIFVAGAWYHSKGYLDIINKELIIQLFIIGCIGIALHNLGLFLGLEHATAGIGVVFIATSPIFAEILSKHVFKTSISFITLLWSFISLIGIIIIIGMAWKFDLVSFTWLILATIALAVYNVFASKMMKEYYLQPSTITFFTIGSAMIFFAPLALIEVIYHPIIIEECFNIVFWFSILYLSFFGVLVGRSLYNRGVQITGASISTVFMNISPIFTIILEFFILDTTPKLSMLIGSFIVIIGVFGVIKEHNNN